MKYLSICSGIEAATQAWHVLGWQAVAFAEIEPFPAAVLDHHYPEVPNLGDMTRWRDWPEELLREVDILVGGTPCQAFSIAGLRESLADERGNLTLILVHLYDHITSIRHAAGRPAPLLLWENVPGVLNTKDNAFGYFLGGLAGEDGPLRPPGGKWTDAGYVRGPSRAIAWRILDTQYFGLAQRRRRVFALASPGDGPSPEQILFEFDGLRRDSPPRREAGEGITGTLSARTQGGGGLGTDFDLGGGLIAYGGNNTSGSIDATPALNANRGCHNPGDFEAGTLLVDHVTHSLRGEGHDASEDGTGRGTPIVPIAFPEYLSGTQCAAAENLSPTLQSVNPTAVAFNLRGREGGAMPEMDPDNLASQWAASGGSSRSYVAQDYAVRRLTPTECERLMGLPDDYTRISWRGRPAADCQDGPRYKAIGNSMGVTVMRWIGSRIATHLNPKH